MKYEVKTREVKVGDTTKYENVGAREGEAPEAVTVFCQDGTIFEIWKGQHLIAISDTVYSDASQALEAGENLISGDKAN